MIVLSVEGVRVVEDEVPIVLRQDAPATSVVSAPATLTERLAPEIKEGGAAPTAMTG